MTGAAAAVLACVLGRLLAAPRAIRAAAVLACVLGALIAPATGQAAAALELGFFDGVYSAPAELRDPWLQRTVDAGAGVVRIDIGWVAPNVPARPAGFDPRDPADPAYGFAAADSAIRAAEARGLRILASFVGAPIWAQGPGRPADAPAASWRPDPTALEDYGAALGQRYSGRFPDPEQPGRTLPRVDAFQVWNEPNLSKYLSPQWSGRRVAAPAHYRRMLNAFGRGVRSAGADALIVTAGTAPFGDPLPGGDRIMPARFVRALLCLRRTQGSLSGTRCPAPARFDVLAHHPYSVGTPRRRALNPDDVSIPDLGKLTRVLRAAERTGGAPQGEPGAEGVEAALERGGGAREAEAAHAEQRQSVEIVDLDRRPDHLEDARHWPSPRCSDSSRSPSGSTAVARRSTASRASVAAGGRSRCGSSSRADRSPVARW